MELTGVNGASDTAPITGPAGGALGKDEFMKLLVTQMQNQDPMKPTDNTAMIAEMAQFSSLEQMQNLNSQFEQFQQNTTAALSLMNAGRPVTLELKDGSRLNGTLEKVQWNDGETQFVIDGKSYSASKVTSLSADEAAEETVG